jgi:hypothetical protein
MNMVDNQLMIGYHQTPRPYAKPSRKYASHGLSNVDEVEKNDIGLPTVDGSAEIDMSANAATPRRRIGSPSPKTERYMDAEYLYLQVMIDQI